jgi:hypothetical protein
MWKAEREPSSATGLRVVEFAGRWEWRDCGAALQQMLQSDQQGAAEEDHHHMRLDGRLPSDGTPAEWTTRFSVRNEAAASVNLHVPRPKFFGCACRAERRHIDRSPGMAGLNAPQMPLHFVAVFQAASFDGFARRLQRLLNAVRKPVPDGFLFFLAGRHASLRAAMRPRIRALAKGYLLQLPTSSRGWVCTTSTFHTG